MISTQVRVEGMKEIADRLNAMGKAGNRIARKALVGGGKIMQDEIKRRVPAGSQGRHFGKKDPVGMHLRDSIGVSTRETIKGWMASVGPKKLTVRDKRRGIRRLQPIGVLKATDTNQIAWWLEYGTKPHYLGAKSASRFKGGKASKTTGIRPGWARYRGKVVTLEERGRGAFHPGTKPIAFMSKSFDAKKDDALRSITGTLKQELGL